MWSRSGTCANDLCELASDLDPGDLFAALVPKSLRGVAVVIVVDGVSCSVDRSLDERPPKVLGAVLRERSAEVPFAGLVDAGTEPGVATELFRRGEAWMSPISEAIA